MSLIKISEKIPFTSSKSKILPVSVFIDVTPLSVNPHGFIIEKADKSVFTFNASPCMVQKREHFTPKAQIFLTAGLLSYPNSGGSLNPASCDAILCNCPNH